MEVPRERRSWAACATAMGSLASPPCAPQAPVALPPPASATGAKALRQLGPYRPRTTRFSRSESLCPDERGGVPGPGDRRRFADLRRQRRDPRRCCRALVHERRIAHSHNGVNEHEGRCSAPLRQHGLQGLAIEPKCGRAPKSALEKRYRDPLPSERECHGLPDFGRAWPNFGRGFPDALEIDKSCATSTLASARIWPMLAKVGQSCAISTESGVYLGCVNSARFGLASTKCMRIRPKLARQSGQTLGIVGRFWSRSIKSAFSTAKFG